MAACSVAKECYKKYQHRSSGEGASAWRKSLPVLCRALRDPDPSVASSAQDFMDEVLPTGAGDRMAGAVRLLASGEGQESFLSTGASLLLALAERSPQAEIKLSADPLGGECNFKVKKKGFSPP